MAQARRRRHLYVAMVEQADLTCGDHYLGLYSTLRKAKAACVENAGGERLRWASGVEDPSQWRRYAISAAIDLDDPDNPTHYTIWAERPT